MHSLSVRPAAEKRNATLVALLQQQQQQQQFEVGQRVCCIGSFDGQRRELCRGACVCMQP